MNCHYQGRQKADTTITFPQSLFSMEGEILTCKDNSKVYAEILKCLHPEEVINVKSCDKLEYKAIIFDERAVTN